MTQAMKDARADAGTVFFNYGGMRGRFPKMVVQASVMGEMALFAIRRPLLSDEEDILAAAMAAHASASAAFKAFPELRG